MEGKRGSECLLKSVSNIDFNPNRLHKSTETVFTPPCPPNPPKTAKKARPQWTYLLFIKRLYLKQPHLLFDVRQEAPVNNTAVL